MARSFDIRQILLNSNISGIPSYFIFNDLLLEEGPTSLTLFVAAHSVKDSNKIIVGYTLPDIPFFSYGLNIDTNISGPFTAQISDPWVLGLSSTSKEPAIIDAIIVME